MKYEKSSVDLQFREEKERAIVNGIVFQPTTQTRMIAIGNVQVSAIRQSHKRKKGVVVLIDMIEPFSADT